MYQSNVLCPLYYSGVKRITELFESYYGDSSTAYILTSDHGMTEWGESYHVVLNLQKISVVDDISAKTAHL